MDDTPPTSNDEVASETLSHPGLTLSPATWAAAGALTKWVGEKAAGGLVSAAVGKAFSEVMELIGMGGPDLAGKLDQISDQLVAVQRSLDRLTAMTEEILKQLAELRDFFVKSLKEDTVEKAMGRIDEAYGSPSRGELTGELGATPISMRTLVEKMPHWKGITDKDLQGAAKDFADWVSDLPNKINSIHLALTQELFGKTSLPAYWAKELAQQVNTKKLDREAAYLVLEGYFLQVIAAQLKGVTVHCVALGKHKLGPQLIAEYLQDNFAAKMENQTASYLEAVELLMVLTVPPTMPTAMQDGMGRREFPKQVDELLLRADLVAAALNLAGRKANSSGKPAASLCAAIQGIYGRALMRPSDLNNGKPPAIALTGYNAVAGTAVHTLPFRCLDLIETGGRPVLKDEAVTLAHYFWPFRSPEPAPGKEIEPKQRGGVMPALYPVFGPGEPGVLAASVFDVSRLYRGLPAGAKKSYDHSKFPGGNNDLGYYNQICNGYHHALTNDSGDSFDASFNAVHIWRLETRQHSYVVHPLFNYAGATIKVRITAHVASIIQREPRKDGQGGTAFGQWWDVYNHLKVRRVKGQEKEFYNSVEAYGSDRPISAQGSDAYSAWHEHYEKRRDGFFSVDLDLEPGDYELVLDNEVAFDRCSQRYEGWQSTSLAFYLHGLSIERVA
jgi:hypothetical protein